MLLSLSDAKSLLPASFTEPDVISIASGLSHALRLACNRIFADRIESISTTGTKAVVTVYRHGLEPGDKVRLATGQRGSAFDTDVVVNAENFDRDSFEVDVTASQDAAYDAVDSVATMRRVWVSIKRTRSCPNLFVDWRPLVAVLSLSVTDNDGGWTELDASSYAIAGGLIGGCSKSGEISLVNGRLPGGNGGQKWHPAGARVEYVAEEPDPPASILYAIRELTKRSVDRNEMSEFQSENRDYYSYSRLSAEQIGSLFGEADRIIQELRIPA